MSDHDGVEWPVEWFGSHRAYRINMAVEQLKQRTIMVCKDAKELIDDIFFEAAALPEQGMNDGIPPRNFTHVHPIDWDPSNGDAAQEVLEELREHAIRFIKDNEDLIDECLSGSSGWSINAIEDFKGFDCSDHHSVLTTFDHCVGLFTRFPISGFAHSILCGDYLRGERGETDNLYRHWYDVSIAKPDHEELFGVITARPNGSTSIPDNLESKAQRNLDDTLNEDFFFKKLLPLVMTPDRVWKPFPALELLTIPLRAIHRWEKPSHGPFLGWLHIKHRCPDEHHKEAVLEAMWPFLDIVAMEILNGEVDDFLDRYDGKESPLAALQAGISAFSGWTADKFSSPRESRNFEHYGMNGDNRLVIKLDAPSSAYETICLLPNANTIVPPEGHPDRSFGLGRLVHRTRMVYRRLCHLHAQSESVRLRGYEQTLKLLSIPLSNLTNSLAEMQRDSQELRAILYDPAKALFESSVRVRELFEANRVLRVSGEIQVETSHAAINYTLDQGYAEDRSDVPERSWQTGAIVTLVAVCRIFGVEEPLREAVDFDDFRLLAERALRPTSQNRAFKKLWDDISWLVNDGAQSTSEEPLGEILDMVRSYGTKKRVMGFLDRLKATLFSPFKVALESWDCMAVELAIRPYMKPGFRSIRKSKGWPRFGKFSERSPVAYSSILGFIIGVCLSSGRGKVTALRIEEDAFRITLRFSNRFSKGNSFLGDSVKALRSRIQPVMEGLRDWRLVGASVGDWEGPFIELANRLIGLDPGRKPDEPQWVGWFPKRDLGSSQVIALEHTSRHSFSVSLFEGDEGGSLVISFPPSETATT